MALSPARAHAQGERDDILIRIIGPVDVGSNEIVGAVVVINGDVLVAGAVTNGVVVVNGDLTVRGRVEGDVTVVNGTVRLEAQSRVENVRLVRSDLVRAQGAEVTGEISRRERVVFRGSWLRFSFVLWAWMTVTLLVSGLVFAAIGGRQLNGASGALTERAGQSLLGALAVWIGLPILAAVAIVSVIGLPLGIAVLVFVLPVLWFLGVIVAGTRIGSLVLGGMGRPPAQPSQRPFLAALVGILALQLFLLVPGVGALVLGFAGLWGAGGIAYFAFQALRGGPPPTTAAAEPAA